MAEQCLVANGEVLFLGEVPERRGQAVAAVFLRCAAGLPERVLKALGECLEGLPALDDLDVFPSGVGEDEVVEDVSKGHAANRDVQGRHGGEVRQSTDAGQVLLREEGADHHHRLDGVAHHLVRWYPTQDREIREPPLRRF